MEVIGTKTFIDSVSTRMSPGSFPNQPTSQGANCKAAPMTKSVAPSMINHFAIGLSLRECQKRASTRFEILSL